MKGNCAYVGSAIPPIISHLDVHLEIIILEVTEELFLVGNMEWSSYIQVPHRSHHWWNHANDDGEIQLKLWSKFFTYCSYWGLLVSLLVRTLCSIVSKLMLVKTFHLWQASLLSWPTEIRFRMGHLSFTFLHLSIQGTVLLIISLWWGSIFGALPNLFLYQVGPQSLQLW